VNLTAQDVAKILEIALICWLVVLAAFVFYAVLLRGRKLVELLTDDNNRYIAPERVTELFIILMVAGYYLLNGGSADIIFDEATNSYWMPDIPQSLLVLLAGGKSVFLAGKMARTNS